jgi:hypothetical protein
MPGKFSYLTDHLSRERGWAVPIHSATLKGLRRKEPIEGLEDLDVCRVSLTVAGLTRRHIMCLSGQIYLAGLEDLLV